MMAQGRRTPLHTSHRNRHCYSLRVLALLLGLLPVHWPAIAAAQTPAPVEPTAPAAGEAPALDANVTRDTEVLPTEQNGPADGDPTRWTLKPPKVSGYIQVHYRHAFATGVDPNVDYGDFRVQRARIMFKGEVLPWLAYDVEIDPRAPEVTGILRDAYLAFKFVPRHSLRVGQQKPQFGYENVESSSKLYAVNRTELSDSLSRGGVTLRDVGIGWVGNLKLGDGFRIEDGITLVNGSGMNRQADDTKMKNLWGRLGLRYKNDPGDFVLRIGLSGAWGDQIDEGVDPDDPADDFLTEFKRMGSDVEIDHSWFFVSTEFVLSWDTEETGEVSASHGYYVNLVGKTPWRVGPIARYDVLGDEYKRWTFGAYYGLPEETLRLLLNYEYRQLKDDVRADDKLYVWLQARF